MVSRAPKGPSKHKKGAVATAPKHNPHYPFLRGVADEYYRPRPVA